MSVPAVDAQALLSDLLARNHLNQLIINAYHRLIRKRYERFLASTRALPSKTEAVTRPDPPPHALPAHALPLPHRLRHKDSLDMQLSQPVREDSTDCKLPFNFGSKEKKEEFRQLLRLGKESRPNGQKRSLNREGEVKLPEPRAPLHLKNIVFQELNEKLARESRWRRTDKKRQSCLASFPVLFVDRSSLPNENEEADKM
jgi:hypothetical protein